LLRRVQKRLKSGQLLISGSFWVGLFSLTPGKLITSGTFLSIVGSNLESGKSNLTSGKKSPEAREVFPTLGIMVPSQFRRVFLTIHRVFFKPVGYQKPQRRDGPDVGKFCLTDVAKQCLQLRNKIGARAFGGGRGGRTEVAQPVGNYNKKVWRLD
jgi:hypothetical protein